MKIKSPPLRQTKDWFVSEDEIWVICAYSLRCYFDIPKSARWIQFEASTKPSRNALKVKLFKTYLMDGSNVWVMEGSTKRHPLLPNTMRAITKLRGRRACWYVSVKYW
jgi:hypothetical protein